MTDPRPKQISTFENAYASSGGAPPDGSIFRANQNISILLDNFVPQFAGGRLTIDDSGFDPVPSSDLTSKTVLYYVPYSGCDISLFDGSKWIPYDIFPRISINNSGLLSDRNYDVFVYDNNGVLAMELVAWNSGGAGAGTRASPLVDQEGIYVANNDLTKRYVGTVRTTSAGNFEDSEIRRFVWNAYNRVERVSVYKPNANYTHGVTTTTWATAFSTSDAELKFVCGLSTEVRVDLVVSVEEDNSGRDSLCRATCAIDGVSSQGATDYPVFYLDDSVPLWSHLGNWVATPDYYEVVPSFQVTVSGQVEFKTNDSFSPGGYILTVLG